MKLKITEKLLPRDGHLIYFVSRGKDELGTIAKMGDRYMFMTQDTIQFWGEDELFTIYDKIRLLNI